MDAFCISSSFLHPEQHIVERLHAVVLGRIGDRQLDQLSMILEGILSQRNPHITLAFQLRGQPCRLEPVMQILRERSRESDVS